MSEDYSVHVTVGRKLEIESHSEVFYPTISFVYSNTATLSTPPAEPADISAEPVAPSEPTPLSANVKAVNVATSLRRPRLGRFKLFRSRLGTFATAFVAVLAATLVGAKILGFKTFTVMSGSMEPEYPVGSMIYVKPTDYKSLKVGDVISYVANSDNTIVTHRIVAIETDEKDPEVLRFKTQGDANASADAKLVHYKNVLGTPILTIPYLGYIAHNIQQPPGIYITLVAGTLLLAWTFLPGTLEERRKTARKSVAKV